MEPSQTLRDALTALLDALRPPEPLRPRVAALRARLATEPDPARAGELLRALADLAAQVRSSAPEEPGLDGLKDPLTGLANRMACEQRVRQEYSRWRRYASPTILQVWSVDDFETIKQRCGDQAGDKALALIAQIMARHVREVDFVARYEDEKFVVLLPETGLEDAHVVAERLRHKVSDGRFHCQGTPVRITVSCGYTALAADDTPALLFQRALDALRRARAAGGNGYCSG